MNARSAVRSVPARAGLVANLALSATTVLVVLGLAESLCRLAEGDRPERPVAGYITVWEDGEFYTVASAATGWPPWEDYNHEGLRDRAHAVEKPAGVRRIVVLGDSVTLGYGLRAEEAYPRVLQDLLDARGTPAEVFNVAFSGWSTRQERIAYQRVARKYRPDDVLVAVCLNDIPEIHNNLAPPPRALRALHARSALVRRMVGAERREIHDVEQLFQEPDSPAVAAAFTRFFDELRALRSEVERDETRFGIVVLPFRMQLEEGAPAPVVQDRIAAFGARENVPVLDLRDDLRGLGGGAFLDYDHLSAEGARRVAEALADSPLLAGTPDETTIAAAPTGTPDAGRAGAPPELMDHRLSLLRDPDPRRRASAARALGNTPEEPARALPALARALRDPEASVRAAAAWALGGFGPAAAPAIPELRGALAAADPATRAGAARTLGAIGADGAAPAAEILVPLLADPADEVRWRSEDALARLAPNARLVPLLLPLLADPAGTGRGGAAAIMGRIGAGAAAAVPALIAALSDGRPEVRGKAAWALGSIGPAARGAVPALIRLVDDADVSWRAIDALGGIGPEARAAVPALRAALAAESANARWRAAAALGAMGDEAGPALPDLIRRTTDPVANVRLAAVHALGRATRRAPDPLRDTAARALAEALREDRDGRVRGAAAVSLWSAGAAARHVDVLIAGSRDPDAFVRARCVRTLVRLDLSPEVGAAIAQALDDLDAGVRAEAARALERPRR